jgi:hypothetical protein
LRPSQSQVQQVGEDAAAGKTAAGADIDTYAI